MNKKELQKKIDDLHEHINSEVSNSMIELINELIGWEILLEKECNK